MNFGTPSHNQNNFNLCQGRSNEFKIDATVLKTVGATVGAKRG